MAYSCKSTRNYAKQVHVTYGETKRTISLQEGDEVKELRHLFLQVFSDVLSDQVAPANVKLKQYDDRFADYVELSFDEKLENNAKIRAVVLKQEQDIQTKSPRTPESETNSKFCWPDVHLVILWIALYFTLWYYGLHCTLYWPHLVILWITLYYHWVPTFKSSPIFMRPHPVKQNSNYQLWNPVSRQNNSLLQRNPTDDVVSCDGSFSSETIDYNTVIKTSLMSNNIVSLLFKDNGSKKQYVVTAESGQGGKIKSIEVPIDGSFKKESQFEPVYYYSYTMFKNIKYNHSYLGCDDTGNTTLVTNTSLEYPNPQALFILRQV